MILFLIIRILSDVYKRQLSFHVEEGEIVALIGANGAGKTTTLQTISGILQAKSGSVNFQGKEITSVPGNQIVKLGMSHVPEGRRMFSNLTVYENLMMGAYTRKDKKLSLIHIYSSSPQAQLTAAISYPYSAFSLPSGSHLPSRPHIHKAIRQGDPSC